MKLLEPITIRRMTVRNRIFMSSMGLGLGYTNRRVRDFYLERARGGVGAISIGAGMPDMFVTDDAWGKPGAAETFVERLKGLTGEIQRAGARVGLQFYYGNRFPFTLDPKVGELVAPSARVEPDPPRAAWVNGGDTLRELRVGEIEFIIDMFGKAAAAAKRAGFDFVEIHNAHGLLPCQFFSPTTNHRKDLYGGSLEGRMCFGLECVRAMRKAVGDDYPLSARHGGMDGVPNGYSIAEGVAFAVELEKAGIDLLNVSLGTPPFQGGYVPAGEDPEGTHVHLAEAVKREVRVPVVAVGRIKKPELAETILSQGKADLIAIGRQLIADPEWPAKVASGRTSEIVPCIDCHECYGRSTGGDGGECTVNYCAGREAELALKPSESTKKVFIVGGGPAGMEAARVAAMRGHQVTISERGSQLGGAMLLQAILPGKQSVENLTNHLAAQVVKAGVKVELGSAATPESIQIRKPDAVVFATGAKPLLPEIPGIDKEIVISSADIRELISGGLKKGPAIRSGWRGALLRLGAVFMSKRMSLSLRKRLTAVGIPILFGKRVVVIGGGMIACQLADLLSEKGRRVTVLATEEEVATDMVSTLRNRLIRRLASRKVSLITGVVKIERITDSGVVFVNRRGATESIDTDTVIPAAGLAPSDEVVRALGDAAPEVHVAGDCAEPLKLLHAVHDGAKLGRKL